MEETNQNNTVESTDFGTIDCKDKKPDEVAHDFDLVLYRSRLSHEIVHEKLYGAKVTFINATPHHVASIMCYAASYWKTKITLDIQFKDMDVSSPDFTFSHHTY